VNSPETVRISGLITQHKNTYPINPESIPLNHDSYFQAEKVRIASSPETSQNIDPFEHMPP